ncbi:hypothetical protein ES707_22112 [subsurface metagenome]
MFFKKQSIYKVLEKETDPNKKKLLEDYNKKLIFFGEFLIISGFVPTELENNEYYKRMKSSTEEFFKKYNVNNIEKYTNNINNIYDDWKNHIQGIDVPIYLENMKKLAIEHLEIEKTIIIKKATNDSISEINLLEKKMIG